MKSPFLKDHHYHLYNRGIDGMDIFYTAANYNYLVQKIKYTIAKYGVDLIAYCLMPNHYHFFVRQLTERPLSEWIQFIFNSYSQSINQQLNRKGTLFQGRAKHILVNKEEYRIHLIRYIHFNPVAAKLVAIPEQWPYSNYPECIGVRQSILFNENFIQSYFPKLADYKFYMDEYRMEKQLAEKMGPYYLD